MVNFQFTKEKFSHRISTARVLGEHGIKVQGRNSADGEIMTSSVIFNSIKYCYILVLGALLF